MHSGVGKMIYCLTFFQNTEYWSTYVNVLNFLPKNRMHTQNFCDDFDFSCIIPKKGSNFSSCLLFLFYFWNKDSFYVLFNWLENQIDSIDFCLGFVVWSLKELGIDLGVV